MTYLQQKNKELEDLQKKMLEFFKGKEKQLNQQLKEYDWQKANHEEFENALISLGFVRPLGSHGGKIWKRSSDQRLIVISEDYESISIGYYRDQNQATEVKQKKDVKPKAKKLRVVFGVLGITSFLICIIFILASFNLLGSMGERLMSTGNRLIDGDFSAITPIIAVIFGSILVGVGFLFSAFQKASDVVKVGLLGVGAVTVAYSAIKRIQVSLPESNRSYSYQTEKEYVDAEVKRILSELSEQAKLIDKQMDDQYSKIIKERRNVLKEQHLQVLRGDYNI